MVHHIRHTTRSAQETAALGQEFGRSLISTAGNGTLLCLWGQLGSGKTTFVSGLARGLGITARILSPTFILVRRYQIPARTALLYHLDLYRLERPQDIPPLGLSEMISEPGSVCVIEWPERLGDDIPRVRTDIRFRVLDDGNHEMTIEEAGHDT